MVDDDLEPLITRCPNCSTQFRVTENQLAIASGRVRCGACLTVFQGIDHLILDEEEGFSTGTEADAALDALLDELEPEAGAVGGIGVDGNRTAPGVASVAEPEAPLPEPAMEAPSQLYGGFEEEAEAGLGPQEADDLDSDAALKELAEYAATLEGGPGGGAAPESSELPLDAVDAFAANDDADADAGAEAGVYSNADSAAEAPANTAWAAGDERSIGPSDSDVTGALADAATSSGQDEDYEKWIEPRDESLEQMVDEVVAGAPVVVANDSDAALGPGVAAAHGDAGEVEGGETLEADDPGGLAAGDSEGPDSEDTAPQVGEVSFAREPVRLWAAALAVGFSLLLLLQILYLQLPDWSRDPGWRGFYEGFCGLLGCELPELRAVEALRTRNLVVRSHPEFADVLVVDVMIVNQASFAQRYPDLELRFTSVNGVLVAGRSFAPEEYLAGEARAADLMPPQTPVQVSLEILDPGEDAVNYTLSFN